MRFVLDTNICIYIIKKKPIQVFDKFRELAPGNVGISSITFAELQHGIKKSASPEKNQLALNQFLLPLEIMDFDMDAAMEYGMIRADLEQKGTPIGPLDTLIAAHVKSKGLILVTNNEKEFIRISGLKVENWTKP